MHRFAIAAALIALLLQSCQAIAKSEAKTYFTLVELCASDDATPEAIQEFLDLQVDLNTKDKDENTPLLLCVKRGDIASTKLLIEAGADVNAKNEGGATPLHWAAAYNKNPEILTLLIKAGADVNATAVNGSTPLQDAVWFNKNPEVTTLLIKAGADVNAKDNKGYTPLHFAAGYNENPEVFTLLIRAGADVNAKRNGGVTPLHDAARYNENPEFITLLIKAGADVNATAVNGVTPLDWATANDNPKHAEVLHAAGGKSGKDLP
jgi:ankyrin repeat protein